MSGAAEQVVDEGERIEGVELVVARAADEPIVAGAAGELVRAGLAGEPVRLGVADQRVVARAAAQLLDVGLDLITLAGRAVVGAVADREVEGLRALRIGGAVDARAADEHVGPSPAD